MKKNNSLILILVFLVLIFFASIKQDADKKNLNISVKTEMPQKNDLKIAPMPKSDPKETGTDIVKIPILEQSPKETKKRMTSISLEEEIEMELNKKILDKINPRPYTPIKEHKSLQVEYEIGISLKKVDSLVAQDNYLGFSFLENQKSINSKISLPKKGYFLEFDFDSIDNDTMKVSYTNYAVILGRNINDRFDLGLEYQKNNLVYRSDYHLNFDHATMIGLNAKYRIIESKRFDLSTRLKYLYAKEDSKNEFMLNLKVPTNKVDIGIGYGLSNREAQINSFRYKGSYKRKDDILEFGINYSF